VSVRVGHGFDVHPFAPEGADRPFVLAGVAFAGERGLAGHSDADVIAHAVADALLGAAGLGDIGMHFPDSDPQWAGADSMRLLAHVVGLVRDAGWSIANVDCTVVLEAPKLAPRRDEMQRSLSAVLGADATIKGKRAEGLGALGRGEGVAAWAVGLLERP
jgi:2-C-methyl-D-erythritol 2,4-cyclodiphosphate synthase